MKLREEWRALTGHRVQVKRPRHNVDEVAAIFAALPKADPREREEARGDCEARRSMRAFLSEAERNEKKAA